MFVASVLEHSRERPGYDVRLDEPSAPTAWGGSTTMLDLQKLSPAVSSPSLAAARNDGLGVEVPAPAPVGSCRFRASCGYGRVRISKPEQDKWETRHAANKMPWAAYHPHHLSEAAKIADTLGRHWTPGTPSPYAKPLGERE
jgi:hypothetical protein